MAPADAHTRSLDRETQSSYFFRRARVRMTLFSIHGRRRGSSGRPPFVSLLRSNVFHTCCADRSTECQREIGISLEEMRALQSGNGAPPSYLSCTLVAFVLRSVDFQAGYVERRDAALNMA